jgi:hypothetical protein
MTAMKRGTIQMDSFALAALSSLILIAIGARANNVSSRVSAQPALYVGKFEPIERAPSGIGPLHALNADIRRMKADSNAAAAKFVLHQVKGQNSIDVLAAQIAQKIVDEQQTLLEDDLVKQNETSSR